MYPLYSSSLLLSLLPLLAIPPSHSLVSISLTIRAIYDVTSCEKTARYLDGVAGLNYVVSACYSVCTNKQTKKRRRGGGEEGRRGGGEGRGGGEEGRRGEGERCKEAD